MNNKKIIILLQKNKVNDKKEAFYIEVPLSAYFKAYIDM